MMADTLEWMEYEVLKELVIRGYVVREIASPFSSIITHEVTNEITKITIKIDVKKWCERVLLLFSFEEEDIIIQKVTAEICHKLEHPKTKFESFYDNTY